MLQTSKRNFKKAVFAFAAAVCLGVGLQAAHADEEIGSYSYDSTYIESEFRCDFERITDCKNKADFPR